MTPTLFAISPRIKQPSWVTDLFAFFTSQAVNNVSCILDWLILWTHRINFICIIMGMTGNLAPSV